MSKGTPVKLTASKIEGMKIGEDFWDAIVPGLHVKAGTRAKSFLYAYRTLSGVRRHIQVGRYGVEMKSVDHARDTASAWSLEIANGGDPAIKKQEHRNAATLKDLKVKWEEETAIAKARRDAEDVIISKNELDDLLIVRKKKTTLADLAKNTISNYEGRWKHIIAHFGEDCPLTAITDDEIKALHGNLVNKVKDPKTGCVRGGHVTANRTLTFICTLLALAKDWGMLDKARPAPTKNVSAFVEHGRQRPMTEEELKRFLGMIKEWLQSKNRTDKRIARLASLCLVSGTRSGEFKTSRLSWVNWEANLLRVPKAKGDSWKVIPLGNVAMFILNEIRDEWVAAGAVPEHDWIIPSDNPATHLKATKNAWKKLLKAAQIAHIGRRTKLNLHDLRHTFITRMVNTGSGSQDQAGKIVGHKNRETTDGYSHLMIEPARVAINKTYQDFETLLIPSIPQEVTA